MNTASLDILEKTQLPPSQARAILQVMELELTARESPLAMKSEVREAVHSFELSVERLRTDIKGFESRMEGRIAGLEAKIVGMDGRIVGMDGRVVGMDGRIAGMDGRIAGMDGRIAGMDGRIAGMDDKIANLDVKIVGVEGRLMRWVLTCIMGQTAVIATAVYFGLTHLRR